MKIITVTARNNPREYKGVVIKGSAELFQIDASPWAEENGTIDTATWDIQSGQSGIENEVLDDDIAEALVTFHEAGRVMITVTLTAGDAKFVQHINIAVKDPQLCPDDYGVCC